MKREKKEQKKSEKKNSKKSKMEEKDEPQQSYVCFLRGINIGNKRMKMKELVDCLEQLNYSNVQTYIQTGNIIFDSSKQDSVNQFEKEIENSILENFEFDVPNVVIKKEDYENIFNDNPFLSNEDEEKNKKEEDLYLTFFCGNFDENLIDLEYTEEDKDNQYFIKNNCAYLYISKSYSKSKINNTFFEKKLKINATTRNWKTIKKMFQMTKK